MPEDFPYWENITQRRYGGPSVIYLGAGWAMTARHVGMGEIFLEDRIYRPESRSRRTLLNVDGSPADAMVFEIDRGAELPDLPLIPLADRPPEPGEEVVLIGFGLGRGKVIQWRRDDAEVFGFEWDREGAKRWGSNRVERSGDRLRQRRWSTHSFSLVFDAPNSPEATRHEAHAATGDSGGAVFVKRDGVWLLAGMITSVSSPSHAPSRTSSYGDLTYAADIAFYRSEILRWTRPACSNEEDDDGDGDVDHPADSGCESPFDRDERDDRGWPAGVGWALGAGILLLAIATVGWLGRARQRGTRTPISTSPSSEV